MKRLFLFAIISIAATMQLFAYDFTAKDVNGNTIYYNYLGGDSVAVTSYSGSGNGGDNPYKGTIIIPDSVEDKNNVAYCVAAIEDYAFADCWNDLDSVAIPNHVRRIGKFAFSACYNVKLTLPSSVKKIDQHAFFSCYKVNPNIPADVHYIGDYAFNYCQSIKQDLVIGNSNLYIGSRAFEGCTNLTSLTINSYNTKIAEDAFIGCYRISSISITHKDYITNDDNTAIIEASTNKLFLGCKNTTIPTGVTEIGNYAFYGMIKNSSSDVIRFPDIPNSVTTIGEWAFANCNFYGAIKIPANVIDISSNAFVNDDIEPDYEEMPIYNNGAYTYPSVVVDNNPVYASTDSYNGIIRSMDNTLIAAFIDSNSGDFEIPSAITKIGDYVFYNTLFQNTDLTIPSNIVEIGKCAFHGSNLQSVVLPATLNALADSAFYNCNNLTSVTINNDIANIGQLVFDECDNISEIHYNGTLDWFCKGFIYLGSFSNGYIYIQNEPLENVIIPDTITNIGRYTFRNCYTLKSVELPKSIKKIGAMAFSGCKLDIFCHAQTPPQIKETIMYSDYSAFDGIDYSSILYVPNNTLDSYNSIPDYVNYFSEIRGFSEVENITQTTAELYWLPDKEVVQYRINIYEGTTHFAQYLVDGEGQILSSQRLAPAIHRMPMDTTTSSTDYFVISIAGLTAATGYSYTIDGVNNANAAVYREVGTFVTLNPDGTVAEDVVVVIPTQVESDTIADDPNRVKKILLNGQIFILCNGKTYTLQGAETIRVSM